MRDPAGLFRALADDTRLQMLALIRQHGELCGCDLEHVLEIGQSKVSRHLRYLLNAGLLKDRRVAVWIHYRIAEDLDEAQAELLSVVDKLLSAEKMREMNAKLAAWQQQKKSGVADDTSSRRVVLQSSLKP